jgi:anti-anti-sigma factor
VVAPANASGLALSTPAAGGTTVAELDPARAPALREQLLGLLRSGSSRLVIDLSEVSHCDASGLAVLIGTGRRARLLGGFLRLAAVSPQVDQGLHITGLRPISASSPPPRPQQPARRVPAAQRTQRRRRTRSTHRWRLDDGPKTGSGHRQQRAIADTKLTDDGQQQHRTTGKRREGRQ